MNRPTTWAWRCEQEYFFCDGIPTRLPVTKTCFHRSIFRKTLCIDAIVDAVKDFRGGLMVVSHDQYFITHTYQEMWVVGGGKVNG